MSRIVEHFAASLNRADHVSDPFDYWLLNDALPDDVVSAVVALPFPPPAAPVFDGRRETNNSTRAFFSPEKRERHRICEELAAAFNSAIVVDMLARLTGADLCSGRLRIEYCQDIDGFWLEPHLDISVKKITMLVYLSGDPNLADAGTDIYDASPEHKLVASAPYARNAGLIFVPGAKTWHGLGKRTIRGLRQSLIVNFVSPEWRAVEELAFG